MNKPLQLAAIFCLLVITATSAQAWWGSGSNWSPWGGNNNRYYGPNYAPRGYYGYNNSPRNYGYNNAPRYYDYEEETSAEDDPDDRERKSPFANNPWKKWRAPWSDDDSRWGSGPWDSFGGSMNDFISEMEGDVDMKMKIRAENEARSRSKARTDTRYRGNDWGFNNSNRYGNPYYGYPYYGYPTRP